MLTVLTVIFGRYMRVQELFRDLYNEVNNWKSLPIVVKSSILDIGMVSGSTVGKE